MSKQQTRLLRIRRDIGEKLAWIVEIRGGTAAQFLDPLIRPAIEREFGRIRKNVDAIKAAKARLAALDES